ncbi:MAG: hypothetical protein RMI34_07920, partial [Chloroherpetonaceae bacterium]|nr:hypothetical protein [Chloroherpetonaceae bacterium]
QERVVELGRQQESDTPLLLNSFLICSFAHESSDKVAQKSSTKSVPKKHCATLLSKVKRIAGTDDSAKTWRENRLNRP